MTSGPTILIGIGNEFRQDDGVGPAVIRSIRECGVPRDWLTAIVAEPVDLIEAWQGAALAIIVDAAVYEPLSPGAVHRLVLDQLAHRGLTNSTHGFGLLAAVRLSKMLAQTPDRLVALTVEAERLDFGRGLSPKVAAAIPVIQRMALSELGGTGTLDPSTARQREEPG